MKRIVLTMTLAAAVIMPAKTQEKAEKIRELEKLEQQAGEVVPVDTLMVDQDTLIKDPEDVAIEEERTSSGDTSRIRIGDIITVEESDDETVIRIGHKGIRIKDKDAEVRSENRREEICREHPGRDFRGHLGGVEFGFNNYAAKPWGNNDNPVEPWLDLNSSKSTCFNLFMPPVNLGFTRHFGIVAALGLGWNNYFFDAGNTITVDQEGLLQPLIPSGGVVRKSTLSTTYAYLPVMLEVQIPVTSRKSINVGAGLISAVKLGSKTRVVYETTGVHKEKIRDDFNLNLLRYGATARIGFEMVQIYATGFLSPMFEKNRGPELYPFEVGIALTIHD